MKVLALELAAAGGLAGVYNEQVAGVPHCYPTTPAEFEAAFRVRTSRGGDTKDLEPERVFTAEDGGKVIGFAHATIGTLDAGGRRKRGGFIHFLTYAPGRRAAGQALLDACERHAHDGGADQLWAFQKPGCYPFYHLGFGNLSDRMGHVYALFRMNGYDPDDGEIFMEQRDYRVAEPLPPEPGAEVVVRQTPGRGARPGLEIWAHRMGQPIAASKCGSAGDGSGADEAQDTFFVHWIGVEGEAQGRGWGRYLLQRIHWEMWGLGYRHAAISTDWRNFRALLFYTNYGYRVTDTVYGFAKTGTP